MILMSVGFDQVTKYRAQDHLMVSQSETNIRVYRGKLYPIAAWGEENARKDGPYLAMNFSYVRNPGAAWGFLAGMDDKYRVPFFHVITFICILLIIQYIRMTPWSHRLGRFSLALILSGALGNMIDRVVLNFVIDWIDVRWNFFGWYYAFPNFNFADAAISVGAFLFFIDVVFLERKRRLRAEEAVQQGQVVEL
jgi:signal peptidase II